MTVTGIKGRKEKSGLIAYVPDALPFPIPRGGLYVGGEVFLLGQTKAYKRKVFGNTGIMDGYKTLVHIG
jgi:hypothetical protein